MPVLLVLAEDGKGETSHRYQLACDALGLSSNELDVHFWCRPGMESTIAAIDDQGGIRPGSFARPLSRAIKSLGRPCFVVLDTVVDVALLNENARVPVNILAKKVLHSLCIRSGATVLVTAHPSKASLDSGAFYAGSTAWNNSFRSRLVLKMDEHDKTKRTLSLAKTNYSKEQDIDLYMQEGLLVPRNAASALANAEQELGAVRDLMFELIDRGIYVVRGNGSGQKPQDLVDRLRERGISVTRRRVLEHLATLEFRGELRYQGADKNERGRRAGFVKGPLADGGIA